MDILVKDHKILPDQKVIELRTKSKLIATIIPKERSIAFVSKYIKNIKKDMEYPPKIIINLT